MIYTPNRLIMMMYNDTLQHQILIDDGVPEADSYNSVAEGLCVDIVVPTSATGHSDGPPLSRPMLGSAKLEAEIPDGGLDPGQALRQFREVRRSILDERLCSCG
jgi:hypothetical protein